jgi:hypothetical protein
MSDGLVIPNEIKQPQLVGREKLKIWLVPVDCLVLLYS